jgi:CRP-like cAMP-binding protein
MLVIYEGKAAVLVDNSQVAEKQQHEVVGEAALQTKQRRRATVVATVKCKTLVI